VTSQSLSKLLKLCKECAHRTLSGKLFQQFTRRHENENARALFAHCGLKLKHFKFTSCLAINRETKETVINGNNGVRYFIHHSKVQFQSSEF